MVQQLRGAAVSESGVPDGAATAYAALSAALWDLREALETLLFRLVAEQLVVTSGATRWLGRADDDLRNAIERMRLTEVARAVETEALARAVNCSPESTLRELAAAAEEPWAQVLGEHRDALRALVAEIQTAADANRRLLDAGAKAVRETLDHLGNTVGIYDATGTRVAGARRPFLIDEQA
jgi:hypothetical protein